MQGISTSFDGRYQESDFKNYRSNVELHHYYRISRRFTFWNHTAATFLHDPDPENQLVLGGDSGLQGYALYYFTGNKSLLFNSETRILLFNDVFKLFTVGGVLFGDAGNVWSEKESINLSDLNYDLGFGIRVTVPRSSSGGVIKIIYSYAFSENGLDNRWLFSFSTSKPFSSDSP